MEFATKFGLQKHPKFSELINYILDDPDVINYPNRWATWANESPFLSQFKDDWLDETYSAEVAHLQWKKGKGPQEVYDHGAQGAADYGSQGPGSITPVVAEDIAGAALAATTVVRTSETPAAAVIPGISAPDAHGRAVARAMGRRPLTRKYREVYEEEEDDPPSSRMERMAVGAGLAFVNTLMPVVDAIDTVGSAVTGAIPAVLRAGKSAAVGLGKRAVAGASAIDQAIHDASGTALQAVQGMIVAEGKKALADIMANGPSGERAPIQGLMLPYSVLNGENPGSGRLALGSGSSSSSGGLLPPRRVPAIAGLAPLPQAPAPTILALEDGPVREAPSTRRMSGKASSSGKASTSRARRSSGSAGGYPTSYSTFSGHLE